MRALRWFAEMMVHNPLGLMIGLPIAGAFAVLLLVLPGWMTLVGLLAFGLILWWAR